MSKILSINGKLLRDNPQEFSRVDLNKDVKQRVGVVYPLSKANGELNVSSIVDHHLDRVCLAHSQARLCFSKDKTITYLKGRSIAIVKGDYKVIKNNDIKTLFDIKSQVIDNNYIVLDDINSYYIIPPIVKKIFNIWKKTNYTPSTRFIKQKHVKKCKSRYIKVMHEDYI